MTNFVKFAEISSKMEQVYAGAQVLENNHDKAFASNRICALVSFSADGNNNMDPKVRVVIFGSKASVYKLYEKEFVLSETSPEDIEVIFSEARAIQEKYSHESYTNLAIENIDRQIAELQKKKETLASA